MQKMLVPIQGMHCKSCELLLEDSIREVKEVKKVEVSHVSGRAKIWYEDNVEPKMEEIYSAVESAGYRVGQGGKKYWLSRNPHDYYYVINGALLLVVLYGAYRLTGFSVASVGHGQKSVLMALVVGLVAGVSSCMALIGGLVLAFSARHAESHPEASKLQKFRPHVYFNLGRIFGFGFLGGLMGLVGSVIQPSLRTLDLLTILASGVMILLGLKLVGIFPVLEKINISLPKFVSRLLGISDSVKEYNHRNAVIVGALTFFLPCGFTQAMQIYAISTGSFLQGALIMSLFALGTAPGLLGIGGISSAVSGKKAKLFFAAAGIAVIVFGVFNIQNTLAVVAPSFSVNPGPSAGGYSAVAVQEVKMTQNGYGYSPSSFVVKKNSVVKWIINSTNPYTCASFIRFPAFGISQTLTLGENVIVFTPTKTGRYDFSCSMGMYRGQFIVE